MIAAVADTEAIRLITPEWLAKRSGELNLSDYVVADTNIGEEAIRWLMENVTVPLFIDGVSTTKAHRVVNALRKAKLPYLLKCSHQLGKASGYDSDDMPLGTFFPILLAGDHQLHGIPVKSIMGKLLRNKNISFPPLHTDKTKPFLICRIDSGNRLR